MDEAAGRNVTHYRLTPRVAETRIREQATVTSNIRWSKHALERMNEREIYDMDVLRILRGGMVCEQPEETPMGEWKCKVVMTLRGSREAGVVVIILRKMGLLVKTVEWEDLR